MSKKEKVKKPFYKKWWVWVVAIIVVFAIAGGGEDDTKETSGKVKEETNQSKEKKEEASKTKTEETVATQKAVDQESFKAYAENIKGSPFVKTISVTDNKGLIEYYSSYDEFKQAKPDSQLKEADYKGYFESGDAIEKILVSENVRLLRQFPDLTATSMVLPYSGKVYSINLDRKAVNDYLGFKVEDLKVDDGSWNDKFNNPIVYDDGKRKEFFNKFVQVK